tara:strand:+ start:18315 stop:19178 length:864 start_codon:yes stop_codon:yes gene_type:complete
MIKLLAISITAFFITVLNLNAEKPAYIIYTGQGDTVLYSELLKEIKSHDLIFFGELHNDPIAHWLQFEIAKELIEDPSRQTHIGMEMFEADQQILIDEYFSNQISQSSFESEARLWNNYDTDYKPILELAKENNAQLIATNIPRRYASSVFRDGLEALDSLSNEAKQWMAPLPIDIDITIPSYVSIAEAAGGHGGDNLIYAQAVKDATMAHFILLNMGLDDQLFHLNGSYHSNNWEGIIWFIEDQVSGYEIISINTILADDPNDVDLEELAAADFTIVIPRSMTRTY